MNIDAVLCDVATVREGLLHVLGAGITRTQHESFPSQVELTLALWITANAKESGANRNLKVSVVGPGDNVFSNLEATVSFGDPSALKDGELFCLPVAMRLASPIPKAGLYKVDIEVDGKMVRSLPMVAVLQPNPVPAMN
ncbi:MAG: DUF6941 family protein [Candidatus Xenobia bacterium]